MQLSKSLRLQTGLDKVSPTVAQQLVEALYTRDTVVHVGVCVQVAAATIIAIRTEAWWLFAWAALAVCIGVARVCLVRAYWRSTPAQHGASIREQWVFRFLLGSWANGAIWGLASAALFREADPFGPLLIIICNTAYVSGASVRMSPVPMVAKGHTLVDLVPLSAAAFATFNPYYMAFDLFVFLHLLGIRGLIDNVHGRILRALVACEENAILAADLAETNRHLEEMVTTDALTDLVNRRGFDIRLLQECAHARRGERPISLLLLDVDYFKRFNDRYGHQTGDDCLRRVAAAIRSAIRRPFDIASRYGGEEFAIILPATDETGAKSVSEKVRAAVAALMIPHAASEFGHVTISIGSVTLPPREAPSPAQLIHLADQALYVAKGAGRNQISVHRTPSNTLDDVHAHSPRTLSTLP